MAVPTKMADLDVTPNNNSPAGSESPISTDDFHRAIQAILRTTNAKGNDIASATTTDIGAATAEFVDVTGTTTITGLGTIAAGIVRTVRFTGALTLTHNATSLILPGSANITTANGDVAQFRSLGSGNWKCVGYLKQDGTAVVNTIADGAVTNAKLATPLNLYNHGQCRLDYDGSANLILTPCNGNNLIINGTPQTIPSAGVSLAPAGTVAATVYYIYAYMNAGTMTLEYSATGYSVDTTTGVTIKTGDATRTLVGMARTADSSAVWIDVPSRRYTLSHFNRRDIAGEFNAAASRTTTSGSLVEVNSADRLGFLKWADEDVMATGRTTMSNSNAGVINMFFAITFSGTTDAGVSRGAVSSGAATLYYPMAVSASSAINTAISGLEGYFYVGINASTASGTATLQQGYTGTTVLTRG